MQLRYWTHTGGLLLVLATASFRPDAVQANDRTLPPTTPPGVTLVEVVRELSASSDQVLWTRLGDANGGTLFWSQNDTAGVANCVDACAKEFHPLLGSPPASTLDSWSLVRRSNGSLQWAYQGHPLYTWSREQEPGEVATNVGLAETTNLKTAGSLAKAGSLLPPAGWEVARFDPGAGLLVPAGLDVALVASAQAVILTDFDGYTLYEFDGSVDDTTAACSRPRCDSSWLPVMAPALANPIGEFSVATREDGSRQWAYRTRPLYRYRDDLLPGDVHGHGKDARWQIAALSEHFSPEGLSVSTLTGYGDALTLGGMTLYSGSAFEKYWGGRNLRDSFKVAYFRGKRLGGNACADTTCLESWRPFLAPADAESQGFWEVITRPDGSRQWAYKGFALYTYSGDTAPGQNRGQAVYSFTDPAGRADDLERVAWLANIGNAGGGAGVYWNIAKP